MKKVSDVATIVLVGSFNPGIFHPSWFVSKGLLQEIEVADAQIEVISNDVAIFTTSWVRFEIIGERFTARTSDESKFGPLRDLVVGTFQILEHTPIKNVGLNREISFELESEQQWHAIGHQLVPKALWNKYCKDPGMLLVMVRAAREDEKKGNINIQVRPSLTSAKTVIGDVNNHIDLEGGGSAVDACKVIESDWDAYLDHTMKTVSGLISDAIHEGKAK